MATTFFVSVSMIDMSPLSGIKGENSLQSPI